MLSLLKHLYRFAWVCFTERWRCFDKLSMTFYINSNSLLEADQPPRRLHYC